MFVERLGKGAEIPEDMEGGGISVGGCRRMWGEGRGAILTRRLEGWEKGGLQSVNYANPATV